MLPFFGFRLLMEARSSAPEYRSLGARIRPVCTVAEVQVLGSRDLNVFVSWADSFSSMLHFSFRSQVLLARG